MISKKLLKDYDITTREEYFNIVIESYINGQFKQAKEQFKKMASYDKKYFYDYLQGIAQPKIFNFFFSQF